ncbi:cytochrome b-c1 complex subunit 6, mitochondrial-like isoform X1 [Ciona intestinalis]
MTIEEKNMLYGEEPEEVREEEEAEEEEDDDDDEEDEEDLVDPMDAVRETCGGAPACKNYREELDVCTDRVSSRSNTEEHCTQELFDFLHCSDKCVSQTLFKQLK